MKKNSIMNQKGGVGKSMVASQFAFYCALKLNLRVLFVDLDQQGNSTKVLRSSGLAKQSAKTAGQLIYNGGTIPEKDEFLIVGADPLLAHLESEGKASYNKFIKNFYLTLNEIKENYDVCIFDTSPTPDVRAVCALALSDYAISPIELNQEALDGVQALYKDIEKVQAINPELNFLGLLPNRVVSNPFQKENLRDLILAYGKILLKGSDGKAVCIPSRSAISEAQAQGRPVWTGDKSTAEKVWREIRRVFEALAQAMCLESRVVEIIKEE